jgi:hypothetical protein
MQPTPTTNGKPNSIIEILMTFPINYYFSKTTHRKNLSSVQLENLSKLKFKMDMDRKKNLIKF